MKWILDSFFKKSSYRVFIRENYVQKDYSSIQRKKTPWGRWDAEDIYDNVKFDREEDFRENPNWKMRASGIHLLYQAGFAGLIFGVTVPLISDFNVRLLVIIVVSVFLFLPTAFIMDIEYERQERLMLEGHKEKLDEAAKKLGFHPKSK